MRLVIAKCTVDYLGRLTAHLPSARRLLLFKADGSVSVPRRPPRIQAVELDEPAVLGHRGARRAVTGVGGREQDRRATTHHGRRHRRTNRPTTLASTLDWLRTASRHTCRRCWLSTSSCSVPDTRWCAGKYMTAIGICRGRGPVFDHPGSSGCRRGTCGHYVQGIAAAATQGHCRSHLSDRGATP